ncbi:MAG: hypothetical protein GY720_18560 [bacterium]|nr:hypothetical protein [bacterium]
MLAELLATEGVEEIHRPGNAVGVMAIHGGLEEGTDDIAIAIAAASGAALYAVVQPETLWWHVPSTHFDPGESPALRTFLGSIELAISVHGYGDPGFESTALLGGSDRRLATAIHNEFVVRGLGAISALDEIPRRLRGVHPANPVNRPRRGGVQIELPMDLRRGTVRDLVVAAVVAAISAAAADLSGQSVTG